MSIRSYEETFEIIDNIFKNPRLAEMLKMTRHCYKCSQTLYFGDLTQEVFIHHEEGIFTINFLEEIWRNPIFVIECCWCHAGIESPKALERKNIRRIMDGFKNDR